MQWKQQQQQKQNNNDKNNTVSKQGDCDIIVIS